MPDRAADSGFSCEFNGNIYETSIIIYKMNWNDWLAPCRCKLFVKYIPSISILLWSLWLHTFPKNSYMCWGINFHYFHIVQDKLINPIGVYISIIRIPVIKGGMTIPTYKWLIVGLERDCSTSLWVDTPIRNYPCGRGAKSKSLSNQWSLGSFLLPCVSPKKTVSRCVNDQVGAKVWGVSVFHLVF